LEPALQQSRNTSASKTGSSFFGKQKQRLTFVDSKEDPLIARPQSSTEAGDRVYHGAVEAPYSGTLARDHLRRIGLPAYQQTRHAVIGQQIGARDAG
jgi:hypothetical protein